MDRDPDSTVPSCPADAVPPWSPSTVMFTSVLGTGLVGAATVFSLAPGLDIVRVFLVFLGAVLAGSAISMRPNLWWAWAMGAGASLLAVAGLPSSWDSYQLFFTVLTVVAAVGAGAALLPQFWRYVLVSAVILFHFIGIFMAATSPPTSPWLTDQLFRRVFNPYLQFVYLRNAYHFYSPEPGPASVVAYLIKTENGVDPVTHKKKYKTKWYVTPTRPASIRDPMGLGYYRLLSLNEQLARGSHTLAMPTGDFEKTEMWYRRQMKTNIIPYHPLESTLVQYKLPSTDVVRYLLPSYASHVILYNTADKDEAARTTVKIYRLEHRDLPYEQMGSGQNPYHPSTYRPFFLGEFDVFGKLVNPQEEMLYWMLPVVTRKRAPNDPIQKDYMDYLSVHALGYDRIEEVLGQDENNGVVLNWSLLR